jgi:hypothetical protein
MINRRRRRPEKRKETDRSESAEKKILSKTTYVSRSRNDPHYTM